MTSQEAIAYIEDCGWSTTRLGLDRTRNLLSAMGAPQRRLKFIHVTGSNGKGSTCAMLDAILRAAGYRTGLYTSPYIQDFCERIQVNGEKIPGNELGRITERVRKLADVMDDHPSQFELVTAIAMEYFAGTNCDIVVLEVGMGGALDSTNVIDCPEVAVLTNIGLEHMEYLGDTLEKIAATKAGIIKRGCHAVCYDSAPEVTRVVRAACEERDVPLRCVDFASLTPLRQDLDGQRFLWNGTEYSLALLGQHQLHNAAVVLNTVSALRERGWDIPEEAVRSGMETVRWPARLEVVNRCPLFILDGGHNPQCAEALTDSLPQLLHGKKAVFLLGVLADKDYPRIMELLKPFAQEFICLTPLSSRALQADALEAYLMERGMKAHAETDIPLGIRTALDMVGEDGAVIAFGSLYLVGAIRSAFDDVYRKWLRSQKIKERDSLSAEARMEKSESICRKILELDAYHRAKTVMLYKYTRGEVQLTALETENGHATEKKRFVYPLCIENRKMLAIAPINCDIKSAAWNCGAFGIAEPDPEQGKIVEPEEIDLVICPCSSFDECGHRLGMGGGYYDRFLPSCTKATVIAVAFEAQKSEMVPVQAWDVPVEMVVTEQRVIDRLKSD